MVMPRIGRTTLPYFSTCSTSPLAVSIGMAKPTPDEAPLPAHRDEQIVALFNSQCCSGAFAKGLA